MKIALFVRFLGFLIITVCVCYAGLATFTDVGPIKISNPFIRMPVVQLFLMGSLLFITGTVMINKVNKVEVEENNNN